MIKEKKKSFAQRKTTLLLCLIGVLAVALSAYFIISFVIDNTEPQPGDSDFEILEGESWYLNYPLAYPTINSAQIFVIDVKQGDTTFQIARISELDEKFQIGDEFVFSANGSVFIPPIAYQDSYFDYTDLYASDAYTDGAQSMSKLTYICSAVGTLSYDERIYIPDYMDADSGNDEAEMAGILSQYGFKEENKKEITFVYQVKDDEGNAKYNEKGEPMLETITIEIGDKVITDAAYYFRVSGTQFDKISAADPDPKLNRDNYIYATTTPYFEYALLSLEDYIDARLVAAGVSGDGAYGPSLTPDYTQWKNTIYEYSVFQNAYTSSDGKVNPDPWTLDSELKVDGKEIDQVYADVSIISPIDYMSGYITSEDISWIEDPENPGEYIPGGLADGAKDGYNNADFADYLFSLEKDKDYFEYLLKNLVGKQIGKYDGDGTNPSSFILTELGDYLPISFYDELTGQEKASVTYTYKIIGIESVFTEGGESFAAGTPVLGAEKVKITYTYKIDGVENKLDGEASAHICHAIIDLSEALIPPEAISALEARAVGELTAGSEIEFDITYTKENANIYTTKVIITDIFKVFNKDGTQMLETVAEDSIVQFRYYYEINGMASEETSLTLELALVNDESLQLHRDFKSVLVGKKMALDKKYEVLSRDAYHQSLMGFVAYEVKGIDLFSASEMIVSFKFLNINERDPFYGESIFDNTMDKDSDFYMYAINSSTCQSVTDLLGGTRAEAGGSVGYVGLETVSTKITPELMKKYGLFANTIYFELPRGIYSIESEDVTDEDTVLYAHYETLGFTIYISDEQYDEDGKTLIRYAASLLYGTIVKVDAEDFKFLDKSFIDIWARRELFFADIEDVEEIEVNFNWSDLKGDYKLAFKHDYSAYVYNNVVYDKSESITSGYKETEVLSIGIAPIGDISGFTQSLFKDNYSTYNKTSVYGAGVEWVNFNNVYGGAKKDGEFAATSNMREIIRALFYLSYNGTVSEAEQEAAKAETAPVMSLKFKMQGNNIRYGYDFYRLDDRRMMVSIYRIDTDGTRLEESSHFYISTPAVKKIAGAFTLMLNGGDVVNDDYYIDGKKTES